MIKKLQRKFITITMTSLALVVFILLGSINAVNLYKVDKEINGSIKILSDNDGEFPKYRSGIETSSEEKFGFELTPETQFQTRYFTVKLDKNSDIMNIDISHVASVTSYTAATYANKAMEIRNITGLLGDYKYAVISEPYGNMLIFVDCRTQIDQVTSFLLISLSVAIITLLLVFILVYVLSKKAIKPIIESMEKQKQFITDAGHEIKTPLAIISANAEVIEMTSGKSEWLTSIKNQTSRLDELVKNLLLLSKMNEDDLKLNFCKLSLSEVVKDVSNSFKVIAEREEKDFIVDIKEGVFINGDKSSITQLISTLIDNAIKYSNYRGNIKISLAPLKKGAKLEVFNTADKIDKENLNKLFDRFYRTDMSRARETGGYGIGLSIVKSIVEMHRGKISVVSRDGKSICFTVVI